LGKSLLRGAQPDAELPDIRLPEREDKLRGTFAATSKRSKVCLFTSGSVTLGGKGFKVVAKRWIVERAFGWNNGQRRA